jgi:hypothetical protein
VSIFATVQQVRLEAKNHNGLLPVLCIEHVPLVKLSGIRASKSSNDLRIGLAAVCVPQDSKLRDKAVQELEKACVHQKVKIQLMTRQSEGVAQVVYGRIWVKNLGLWRGCLASRLLGDGLAIVAAYPGVVDPLAVRYLATLEKVERAARKRRKGVWQKRDQEGRANLLERAKSWLYTKFRR